MNKIEVVKTKGRDNEDSGVFIMVNKDAAISIIASLSAQLVAGNNVVGRREYYDVENNYFSIGVTDFKGD